MKPMKPIPAPIDAKRLTRRHFLKKSSLATLMGLSTAPDVVTDTGAGPDVPDAPRETARCAVIGFGSWGRELAATLQRMPEAEIVAVCDTYGVMRKRAEREVPGAATHEDYRVILDDPAVQAVFVATPTHRHRDIVVAALATGKHVYCEAPLAATLDDARTIARAARDAGDRLVFQAGLQYRFDPQYQSVSGFIRSGALGKPVLARAQYHIKNSWRRTSPNAAREKELNWRLDPAHSPGLIGELGIHQLDTARWILENRPMAVNGFGNLILWDDGRTLPDTIQTIFEFPGGVHLFFDATLASSFDGRYELFSGSDSTIMLRDSKGWMFKEVDAPMIGWEVYARKDKFYKEQGIALVANATQLDAQGQDPTADDPNAETPVFYAVKDFLDNVFYGPFESSAGYLQGFEATVMALKANEAVLGNQRIAFDEAWFSLD